MRMLRVVWLLVVLGCAGKPPPADRSPAQRAAEDEQCTDAGAPCGDAMLACCPGLVCRGRPGNKDFLICGG